MDKNRRTTRERRTNDRVGLDHANHSGAFVIGPAGHVMEAVCHRPRKALDGAARYLGGRWQGETV